MKMRLNLSSFILRLHPLQLRSENRHHRFEIADHSRDGKKRVSLPHAMWPTIHPVTCASSPCGYICRGTIPRHSPRCSTDHGSLAGKRKPAPCAEKRRETQGSQPTFRASLPVTPSRHSWRNRLEAEKNCPKDKRPLFFRSGLPAWFLARAINRRLHSTRGQSACDNFGTELARPRCVPCASARHRTDWHPPNSRRRLDALVFGQTQDFSSSSRSV